MIETQQINKSCRRCIGGTLWLEVDDDGPYWICLQCGCEERKTSEPFTYELKIDRPQGRPRGAATHNKRG